MSVRLNWIGFDGIEVSEPEVMHATRLDLDSAWVRFTLDSIEQSTGKKPVLCPTWAAACPTMCLPTS